MTTGAPSGEREDAAQIIYEPFRGDVAELERMAHAAWRDEYPRESFPNLYDQGYFGYLFGALEHRDHLLAAYDGAELVSFVAFLPRRFHFRGEMYRAALGCLMVTRRSALRRGIATGLISAALELNRTHDYDFALMYLESGHRSSKMMEKLRKLGHSIQKVKRMGIVARALDLDGIFASENLGFVERLALRALRLGKLDGRPSRREIRPFRREDLDACLAWVDAYRNTARLARVLAPEELLHELSFPPVTRTLVWDEGGRVRGFVNWVCIDHLGKATRKWAWLNHVAFGDLGGRERGELVRAFLLAAREQGALGVIEWAKNYYSKGPLWRNRFFPFPRSVDMMAWVFRPGLDLSGIPDVFEVQI